MNINKLTYKIWWDNNTKKILIWKNIKDIHKTTGEKIKSIKNKLIFLDTVNLYKHEKIIIDNEGYPYKIDKNAVIINWYYNIRSINKLEKNEEVLSIITKGTQKKIKYAEKIREIQLNNIKHIKNNPSLSNNDLELINAYEIIFKKTNNSNSILNNKKIYLENMVLI